VIALTCCFSKAGLEGYALRELASDMPITSQHVDKLHEFAADGRAVLVLALAALELRSQVGATLPECFSDCAFCAVDVGHLITP
jgi:hypothetical protein